MKRESYTAKLKSLEALGVNMTRASLHMRVFKAYKARDGMPLLIAYYTNSDDEDDMDVPVEKVHVDRSGSKISSIPLPEVVTKKPGRTKGSTDQKKRR